VIGMKIDTLHITGNDDDRPCGAHGGLRMFDAASKFK
jgi:hypothetical protein